ncbi:aldo/keto reductase [Thermobrachium celere]|uniref:Ferredoxin n=1 Tax=Thermobrachium celere DSM 8682 TaxID=941824 RepID=R7RSM3_9CLOT|nr:aldo/keto reductase [Thermobrachium celere]CDF58255.1 Ferredoxin [Thermobrachium celere DSM 8682]
MKYYYLGRTNLKVSKLCFGSLTVGPLQANLPVEEGAKVIAHAFDKGVNFIDTAKLYKTYPYIKRALELSKNKDIIISSKSYDYTYEGMRESVQEALEGMGVKKLGIFMLHEQESRLTLKGHEEALRYLIDAKKQGIIDAVGVSTHAVEVVEVAAYMPEIDVIHPIVNIKGLGIIDGTIEDMLKAIKIAYENGKGIFAMKPLGGGNLINSYDECIDFVLNIPHIHSIALGMQSIEEVEANISKFNGKLIDENLKLLLKNKKKRLLIEDWCSGCGKCVEACHNNALSLVDNKATVDEHKCLLCGYCSQYCRDFCIKIV